MPLAHIARGGAATDGRYGAWPATGEGGEGAERPCDGEKTRTQGQGGGAGKGGAEELGARGRGGEQGEIGELAALSVVLIVCHVAHARDMLCVLHGGQVAIVSGKGRDEWLLGQA